LEGHFRVRNTLGARYLDYLLHSPNEPIHAFDLEVEVQPEKGEARSKNSFQPESDAQAMREYRQELGRLQMKTAQAAGELEKVARLEGEVEALKSALKGAGAADTGERAFDNVRKALRVVLEQLRSSGLNPWESVLQQSRLLASCEHSLSRRRPTESWQDRIIFDGSYGPRLLWACQQ
jgi:hypothetical protein